MTTGVHNTFVLRSIGHLIGLQDGQRIHVATQGDGSFARVFTLNQRYNAIVGNTVLVFNTECGQLLGYKSARFHLLKGKFRVSVQVPTVGDHLRVVLMGKALDMFFHV